MPDNSQSPEAEARMKKRKKMTPKELREALAKARDPIKDLRAKLKEQKSQLKTPVMTKNLVIDPVTGEKGPPPPRPNPEAIAKAKQIREKLADFRSLRKQADRRDVRPDPLGENENKTKQPPKVVLPGQKPGMLNRPQVPLTGKPKPKKKKNFSVQSY